MNKKFKVLLYSLAVIGLILTLPSGCKKEDDDDIDIGFYNDQDIEGIWQFHSLVVSGSSLSSWKGWAHGLINIDENGDATISDQVKSDGSVTSAAVGTILIASSGVVTIENSNTYQGFMSADKRTINVTMGDEGGGYNLMVVQKMVAGTTYSMTDLAGTWQFHSLVEGDNSVSSWTGWMHGTLSINASGNTNYIDVIKSDGSDNLANAGTISISPDGSITMSNDNTFHGYLSADKSTLIITMTDGGGGYNLTVAQKEIPGVTYTTADLQGAWKMHGLMNGGTYALHNVWMRALFTVNENGYGEVSNVSASDGDNYFGEGAVSISESGVITLDWDDTFHGYMSGDKRTIYETRSYPVIVTDSFDLSIDTVYRYNLLLGQFVPE